MTHTYKISGMTCGGCIGKAKNELLKLGDVMAAEVQLEAPQATITMQRHIATETLQAALKKAGNFTITEADGGMETHHAATGPVQATWWQTYKPILLIGGYLTGITLLAEAANGFDGMRWMQHFMAGFFLVFSFFKLLDLKGFAESYATYDIVARQWMGWGYIYAVLELFLGLAFLTGFAPVLTNGLTFAVMSISLVGVLQSVLAKKKIRCACLGAVFNLPMSAITITEDVLMIAMSGIMLFSLI
jgi:copper chaperone CopZ